MVGIKRPTEAWPSHFVRGVGERSRAGEAMGEPVVEGREVRMPE